jgi:tetratricopeptide (TPR) repeat protein
VTRRKCLTVGPRGDIDGRMSKRFPDPAGDSVRTRLQAAEQLWRAGRNAQAEMACRDLLALQRSAAALCLLALLLAERGELAQAEKLLREAIEAEPKTAALRHHLGNLLQRRDDPAGAEKAYRKAIQLKTDYWEAFYNLGVVLSELGREDEALAAQRRAIALNPAWLPAKVQAGAMLLKRGEHREALVLLDAAVAAKPDYFDAHYYRGLVLAAQDRLAEAAAAQARAAAIAPARFESHLALGHVLARDGREEDALAAYRRALEADPGYLPAHRAFNDLAWEMGLDVWALGTHAFARAKLGDRPDLLLSEAELRLRFRDGAAAEALLERAQVETRADIAHARGRALVLQGRFADAAAQFSRAIAAEPSAVSHRHELAVALLKDGRPDAARVVLIETEALTPHDQMTLGTRLLAARLLDDADFLHRFEVDDWAREIEVPVPSGFTDAEQFNAALAAELTGLHSRRAAPLEQTLNNGTQTPAALFGRPSKLLSLLEDSLRLAIADYIGSLPDDPSHPFLSRKTQAFDFAGSWSCRLFSSGFHTNHVHSQGWISSAYYVDLPSSVAAGTDTQGALKFGESPFGLGEKDRPRRMIKPSVGKLVLFPSYFWHGTVPFAGDRARLTVAFDVVPRR